MEAAWQGKLNHDSEAYGALQTVSQTIELYPQLSAWLVEHWIVLCVGLSTMSDEELCVQIQTRYKLGRTEMEQLLHTVCSAARAALAALRGDGTTLDERIKTWTQEPDAEATKGLGRMRDDVGIRVYANEATVAIVWLLAQHPLTLPVVKPAYCKRPSKEINFENWSNALSSVPDTVGLCLEGVHSEISAKQYLILLQPSPVWEEVWTRTQTDFSRRTKRRIATFKSSIARMDEASCKTVANALLWSAVFGH